MIETKEQFIARAVERFDKGRAVYGDATWRRPPREIIAELQDELVDAVVYAFILRYRFDPADVFLTPASRAALIDTTCLAFEAALGLSKLGPELDALAVREPVLVTPNSKPLAKSLERTARSIP